MHHVAMGQQVTYAPQQTEPLFDNPVGSTSNF